MTTMTVRSPACRIAILVLAVLLGTVPAVARAATITDGQFHFSFAVPEGFVRRPAQAGMLYLFAKMDPGDGGLVAILNLQRMDGTIGRGHAVLPPTPGMQLEQVAGRWKSYDLDVVRGHATVNGARFATRVVQFPVAGEAIQLNLLTPVEHEAEIGPIFDAALAGFDAPSNWATGSAGSPTSPSAEPLGGFGPVLGGTLWGSLLYVFLRSRPARPSAGGMVTSIGARTRSAAGTGLLVGAALFVVVAGAGIAAIGSGRGVPVAEDAARRGRLLAVGTTQLSGWVAWLFYGLGRFALRMKHGPVRAPLAPPTSAPAAVHAAALEHIQDD